MNEERNQNQEMDHETNAAVSGAQKGVLKRKKRISKKADHHAKYVPSFLRNERKTKFFIVATILSVLLIAAVVAAIVISLKTVKTSAQYVIHDPSYMYYGETATPVGAGSTLDIDEGGTVTLTMNGTAQTATLPIYVGKGEKIVLPVDYAYYLPRTGERSYVAPITEIACDPYDNLTFTHNESSASRMLGFLHDGKDFYIFLEPVVVKFNNYTLNLPTFSWVEAVNKENITVFNYETKQFFSEKSNGRATTASPASGDYTVNLLGDSVTCGEKRNLLVSRPELLELIK